MTVERMANYDLDMVNEYLQHNPQPSIESMESWIPLGFMMEDWMAFIESDWEHKLAIFKQAGNANIEGLPEKGLKEITTKDIDQACKITGKVVGVSEPYAVPDLIEYKCRNCGDVIQSKRKQCCSEKDLELYIDPKKLVDVQVVKVQEAGNTSSPSRMSIIVKGKDMLWKVKQGRKVHSIGLVKFEQSNNGGPVMLTKHFDGYHLEQEDRECDVKLTPEFDAWMRNEIEQPQYWDKLVGSFAPHIKGFREIKEALILLLMSTSEEIPLNIWLAGDASAGKSLFLLYVAKLHQNGHYISAPGATWPGLSATAQQDADTKSWLIWEGALSQADRGVFCFDEVHAIQESIAASLNEAGEQKTVSYAKGGQVGTLPARCAWLFGSNTSFGDWNMQADIQDNFKFLGKAREALISRFVLIFIMRDVIDEANDRQIALQILENRSDRAIEKYRADWKDEQGNECFGFENLMRIFAWYALRKQPKTKPEDYAKLADWYVSQRKKDLDYYHKKTKPRNFDKGVFLAELKAKALGKEAVDEADIYYAMELFTKSRDAAAFDPKTKTIDTGMLEGNKPHSRVEDEQNKDEQFRSAYDSVKAIKGRVSKEDWLHELIGVKQWTETEARKEINKAERYGAISGVPNDDIIWSKL